MNAPTTSRDFDKAYRAPLTLWGDWRIPGEVKNHVAGAVRVLELGCGLGRISRYMAGRGFSVTAVDFSPVAIERARKRAAKDVVQPEFLVDDVRELSLIAGTFDHGVDVGCFHCLEPEGQHRYAEALAQRLSPGATHLIWVTGDAPSGLPMTPQAVGGIFAPRFSILRFERKYRRFVSSWWYWLMRTDA